MRKASYFSQIATVLHELHKQHPTYSVGQHLSTAFDGYGDMWGITDKEFLFALQKHQMNMELDNFPNKEDIDKIIKDAMDLDNILNEESNGEDDE